MKACDSVIVALDFPSADAAMEMVQTLGDAVSFYKVGLQLFTAAGPDFVRGLIAANKSVFLDLKLHEIPNTITGAVQAAGALGVQMLTVHAASGDAGLRAAVEAARHYPQLRILAVTVLTSQSEADFRTIGCAHPLREQVQHLARLADECGCHGVVASAEEAALLKAQLRPGRHIVVPGIYLAQRAPDQARCASPQAARAAGATHLVIGRAITTAENPLKAMQAVQLGCV